MMIFILNLVLLLNFFLLFNFIAYLFTAKLVYSYKNKYVLLYLQLNKKS
jgi:hypothetical protein